MTCYFFHIQDGDTMLDAEGVELPDLNAAREEAIRACGEIVRDIPTAFKNGEPFRLWVTNQPNGRGIKMFTVTVTAEDG